MENILLIRNGFNLRGEFSIDISNYSIDFCHNSLLFTKYLFMYYLMFRNSSDIVLNNHYLLLFIFYRQENLSLNLNALSKTLQVKKKLT